MYKLFTPRPHIAVVGCGGTGGFVAEGLCRLFLDDPEMHITLVDHDRVQAHNLRRQNFYEEDIGRFKAQVLAERLAKKYRRPVQYSINPFGLDKTHLAAGLYVGCVDNAMARQALSEASLTGAWYMDSGNGDHYGQILIGNASVNNIRRRPIFDINTDTCWLLPLPTEQQPQLLTEPERPQAPDCAEAIMAQVQSATINQAMAALILEAVRQLYSGTLAWFQLYIDLQAGTLRTVDATPEVVARLFGLNEKRLINRKEVKHGTSIAGATGPARDR